MPKSNLLVNFEFGISNIDEIKELITKTQTDLDTLKADIEAMEKYRLDVQIKDQD